MLNHGFKSRHQKQERKKTTFLAKTLVVALGFVLVILYTQNLLQTSKTAVLFERQRTALTSHAGTTIDIIRQDRIQQMTEMMEVGLSSEKMTSALFLGAKDKGILSSFASKFLVSVNANEIYFYDRSASLIYSSTYKDPSQDIDQIATTISHLKNSPPFTKCLPKDEFCTQYVGIPLLYKGQDVGIAIIGFQLDTIFDLFEKITGAHIILAGPNTPINQDKQFRAVKLSNAGIKLPDDKYFMAIFSAKEEIETIEQIKNENALIGAVGAFLIAFSILILFRIGIKQENERISHEKKIAQAFGKEKSVLLDKVARAGEDERRHIAMELHDEVGQRLVSIRFNVRAITKQSDNPIVLDRVNQIIENVDSMHATIRLMSDRLRPPLLDTLGFCESLATVVNETKNILPSCEFNLSFTPSDDLENTFEVLVDPIKVALYRIAQESLNNIAKHSNATQSNIHLSLSASGDELYLEIKDNGKGFNSANPAHGIGINNMKDRAHALGGQFSIKSGENVVGTQIIVSLPC